MAIKVMTVGSAQNDFTKSSERFENFSFITSQKTTPTAIMEQVTAYQPHAIVLNCCKATFNEISLCSKIRRNFSGPVIITTNNKESDFETAMLDCGADDILHLPLPKKTLIDHIKAHLERYGLLINSNIDNQQHCHLDNGNIVLDRTQKSVQVAGSNIRLTPTDFDLLWILALHSNKTVTREDLYRILLKIEYDGLDRCIDNRISRLRKRLGDNRKHSRMIKSVRGEGYMLINNGNMR